MTCRQNNSFYPVRWSLRLAVKISLYQNVPPDLGGTFWLRSKCPSKSSESKCPCSVTHAQLDTEDHNSYICRHSAPHIASQNVPPSGGTFWLSWGDILTQLEEGHFGKGTLWLEIWWFVQCKALTIASADGASLKMSPFETWNLKKSTVWIRPEQSRWWKYTDPPPPSWLSLLVNFHSRSLYNVNILYMHGEKSGVTSRAVSLSI